jgi:integrase
MSILRRGKGWQLTLWHKGKRVLRRTYDTKEGAVIAEATCKVALREGLPLPVAQPNDSWTLSMAYSKAFTLYWNDSGYPLWQDRHRKKVMKFFGDVPLPHITSEGITSFTIHLKEQGLSNSTINHSLQSLRKVLKLGDENGQLRRMPIVRSLRVSNARSRFLSTIEVSELLEACSDERLHLAIFISVRTGLRAGELARLEWRHIQGNVLYVEKSKNGDPRSIPLGADLRSLLDTYHPYEGTLVFPDADKLLRRGWEALRQQQGLEGVVWHTLRHTFASHLAQRGVDMSVIKGLMGHRRIETTMRYAKLSPLNYRDAINKLGDVQLPR